MLGGQAAAVPKSADGTAEMIRQIKINSMIESFWSRMQVELLDTERWKTRIELANAILDYLEIWHNRQRRHSQLGMLTPIEFERINTITVA